ncbi:hypothetical protein L1987_88386 [Smallanthus sonchifolius]|nr:hypothetical protein L1987_89908 [Smallanthus sonchifolius]KAI3664370.1 hypothetical protein L1987_89887 [Smallanthus sonchifolius]KAI3664582.1 hypothetical protein L1987_89659 [Smallanthus sonchifolius]KAI3668610.1 hypothetical protein L1987_88386 [Smallanthus sonchifolius]
MDYATWPLQIKEKSYASDTNRAHLEKRNHQLLIQLNQRKRSEKAERSQCEKAKKSRVIYCTAKLANRDLFSQEPDLHARRRTYLSGHILVELLSSRSLWFLGPASHLLALIVHIQRRGKLNKQAIQVDFIESEGIVGSIAGKTAGKKGNIVARKSDSIVKAETDPMFTSR